MAESSPDPAPTAKLLDGEPLIDSESVRGLCSGMTVRSPGGLTYRLAYRRIVARRGAWSLTNESGHSMTVTEYKLAAGGWTVVRDGGADENQPITGTVVDAVHKRSLKGRFVRLHIDVPEDEYEWLLDAKVTVVPDA